MPAADSEGLYDFELMKKVVHQSCQKLDRKLNKQLEEFNEAKKYLLYKQIADSILAAPHQITKHSSKATITNIYTQSAVEVSLNPKLDAQANAQLLYKKAKKAKRGEEISTKKVEATQEELRLLTLLEQQIDQCLKDATDSNKCKNVAEQYIQLINQSEKTHGNSTVTHGDKIKTPYRHYICDDWDIFVGKSDTQNDELSTRFARPSDIWMHAAGYAGSHLVIRRPKDKPMPPPEVLSKAASLAVWFSKAKHTSYCEVHYTEARFVHKRRHAPAGEVIAERCKTLRVSPKSPQELFKTAFLED